MIVPACGAVTVARVLCGACDAVSVVWCGRRPLGETRGGDGPTEWEG